MQETWISIVIWDDLTCCRATKPTPQLLRACALEPKSPNYYSPHSLEPGSTTRVCAKQLQSCPILCDPMDCSSPGFSVHGILQARILEWVVISSSTVSSWLRDQTQVYSTPALTGRFFTTRAAWEAPPQQEKPPQWEAAAAVAAAKLLQSCPTLCDPIDSNLLGSPIPGILQARTLEWVAISFSNAWKWEVKVKSLSRVRLLATPWTAAYQAPLPMGFSRQEYWSGVPLPSLNEKLVHHNYGVAPTHHN